MKAEMGGGGGVIWDFRMKKESGGGGELEQVTTGKNQCSL